MAETVQGLAGDSNEPVGLALDSQGLVTLALFLERFTPDGRAKAIALLRDSSGEEEPKGG